MAAMIPAGQVWFGLQLPVQALSTAFADEWELGAGPADIAEIATACDESGFGYVAVCDHVAIPGAKAAEMRTTWYDTVATLSWLAAKTTHVHLLSHVYVLPYRHPLVTAKAFLTLDRLSGGRAVLGVGAGHVEGEFATLGVDFASRGRLLSEAIGVVRAAFEHEAPVAGGPTWPVADVGIAPRPVRAGGPPIWVGGSSKPAIRRAALQGDGWLPQGPPKDGMKAAIARIRGLRHEAGLPEAFDLGINTEPIYLGSPSFEVPPYVATGTPQEVAERLRRYPALGANQLQVRFLARSAAEYRDQCHRFGAEVGPLLQG